MASKIKETYVCAECGAKSPLWRGQCLVCKAWNSLELVAAPVEGARKRPIGSLGSVKAMPLAHVEDHGHEPFGTGLEALDRVLGRGLVPGSALLMGGQDMADFAFISIKRVVDVEDRAARVAEHRVDALLKQAFTHDLRSFHFHSWIHPS